MAAFRPMAPQVTLVVAALAALCSAAPSPSPAPAPSPSPSASPSLGHHVLPAVWGGPVVAGFPVALPLYAGLEGALAAHAQHAFLAAPGGLLPGAALGAYGYGYPLNGYAGQAAIGLPTASEIYTPQLVQAVHTLQAVPVANTVQVLPVQYGVPKPADVSTEKATVAVTEETSTAAPETDKTADTSQVGGQAVGIDLGATSGAGTEGETSGFSAAGGSGGQLGGAEVSAAGTEAPETEAAVVETATEAPVVQTTTPRGAYKLSIAYGVPRAPTISESVGNNENIQNLETKHFDIQSDQSRPKIQSLDDLISETFSSTAQADTQSSSLGGSRTGSLDFIDVSSDARTLALSGGLDCTGKGCGTKDVHVFSRSSIPSSTGAFRLSLGSGRNEAASNEGQDVSFRQETSLQSSAAIPNRAAKQHYYYDLPHLNGVGATAAAQGGPSRGFSGSSSGSDSSSSFTSGDISSGQGNANGALLGSGPTSDSSSPLDSGDFRSGQDNANGAFSGSSHTSASSSSFASGGFDSPSTSEEHPNYPNSVPIPPKPYSAPVPPYPNTNPPPLYPKYGAPVYSAPDYSPPGGAPVYSAPAYSPPGGSTNRFQPSQPDFGGGSQGGGGGGIGVFTPSQVTGDLDGVYPPAKPPAPAYGLPQPPPPAPIDSYGQPVRDLYDIRSLRSVSSPSSNKQRSPIRRRFV